MDKLLETFKLAIITLRANKLRSLLTMLGIIIGITTLTIIVSAILGAKSDVMGKVEAVLGNKPQFEEE